MPKKLDLIGQRYGKLTVLRPAKNIGDCTAWVCRCDCGRENIVRTQSLRSGGTRTCGCQRSTAMKRQRLTFPDGTYMGRAKTGRVRKDNTSGVSGVEWVPRKKHWKATICVKKKRYYLGAYPKFEDAVKARKQVEEDLYDLFLHKHAAQVQIANG